MTRSDSPPTRRRLRRHASHRRPRRRPGPRAAPDRLRPRRLGLRRAVRVAGDALRQQRLSRRATSGCTSTTRSSRINTPGAGVRGARRARRELLTETGADKIDLLGHSLGTSLMQAYLSVARARREGRALRQHRRRHRGRAARRRPHARDLGAGESRPPDRRRGERVLSRTRPTCRSATSAESFAAQYEFFNGAPPATTDVLPEPHVQLAGRVGALPAEPRRRRRDARDLRGRRRDRRAARRRPGRHLLAARAGRRLRPVRGRRRPALRVPRPADGRPPAALLHPARRAQRLPAPPADRSARQRASRRAPTRAPGRAAWSLTRYREFWGDQGPNSDVLTINGLEHHQPDEQPDRQARQRDVRLRRRPGRREQPGHAELVLLRAALHHGDGRLPPGGRSAERREPPREHVPRAASTRR